jgi:hypothetical protein
MSTRLCSLALALVFLAQLAALWPLPGEVAASRTAYWVDVKSQAEAISPATSENPEFSAKTRAELTAMATAVLADPDRILRDARLEWTVWLGSAILTAAAAVAVFRRARLWRWLAAAATVSYFSLQMPFVTIYRLLFRSHTFDPGHGLSQLEFISRHPGAFRAMIVFDFVAPLLLLAVLIYAIATSVRTARQSGHPNAL